MNFRRNYMLELLYLYGPGHQITPEEYASLYYSSRPWLRKQMQQEAEARALEDMLNNLPDKRRARLPIVSDSYYIQPSRFGQLHPLDHSDLMLFPCSDDTQKQHCVALDNTTPTIVNDKNCYYTKYTYCCPKCGEKISFVDVTSIRFLEKEDKEETDNFSFLELSELPIDACPNCDYYFVNTFFDPNMLKRTVSYKLVQMLKLALSQSVVDNKKKRNWEYPMPEGVEPSLEFVGNKIMLGVHGYSYIVNTYRCCHCKREYNICDLSSLRKEPFFVPKNLRNKSIEIRKITDDHERLQARLEWRRISSGLKTQDKEQSSLPSEQWALPPYCLECGHFLYSYDLSEGEPIPKIIGIPYTNSLFI